MKKKAFAVSLLVLGLLSLEARAITIANFSLTEESLSFYISGTLPAPLLNGLYFVNPDVWASPGFALGSDMASSYSFVGTSFNSMPPLWNSGSIGTGNPFFGDYLFVAFQNSKELSGTITASWSSPAFNLSQVTSLDVYWSDNGSLDPNRITNGTYLTSVAVVPEPSTTALLIAGAVASSTVLRGRKKRAEQQRSDPWRYYSRINRLGVYGCGGGFVLLLLLVRFLPDWAIVKWIILTIASFLWALCCLLYLALLAGFQCPQCGELYFVYCGRPLPWLRRCSKCGSERPVSDEPK